MRVSRVAASLVAVFALAGVSITTSPIGAAVGRGAPSSQKSDAALAAATKATNAAFKGTNRPVDPTPRPAVKGKHVVVISAGQAASSSSVPSDGAVAAAQAIGWQVDLYDAKLDPSNYPGSCARRSRPTSTASSSTPSTARR